MQKIAFGIVILTATLFCSITYANSYDRGIKMYRRADFKGAENAFLDVLRRGANRTTKGRIYKLIGLCQYMMGRKQEAKVSFHSALKYDPKTEIFPDEALDSSVLEFFLQIKQDSKRGLSMPSAPLPKTSKSYPKTPRTPVSRKPPRKIVKKAPPRRAAPAKIAPKKLPPKKVVAKPTRKARAAAPKKGKDSLFGGKSKKPRRITFTDKKEDTGSQAANRLLLPTAAKDGSNYAERMNPWHFFPFGIGQYVNGSFKVGHAFAAAGILTLGSAVYHMALAFDAQTELDERRVYQSSEIAKKSEYAGAGSSAATIQSHLEGIDIWVSEWEDYTRTLQLYSYLSIAGFSMVWIGGVIEAILNRPDNSTYSLLLPKMRYGYHHAEHKFALLWQYPLP